MWGGVEFSRVLGSFNCELDTTSEGSPRQTGLLARLWGIVLITD